MNKPYRVKETPPHTTVDLPLFMAALWGFHIETDRTFRRATRDGRMAAVVKCTGPRDIGQAAWQFQTRYLGDDSIGSAEERPVMINEAFKRGVLWLVNYNASRPAVPDAPF